MSCCLAITSLSVWIWRSHRILARSFSTTLGGIFHSDLQPILSADVPVHYASHLLMVFRVCCSHLTSCYHVLNCLRSVFVQPAPGVLSGAVTPASIDLVLSACSCAAIFQSCLFQPLVGFLISATTAISWWYMCHAGACLTMMVHCFPLQFWVSAA